jgi:uncharacterized protein (DUF58 family)
MSYASYRFIDPNVLAALRDLELVAGTVVDGFMYGAHPSRLPGAGLEFSQYRSYQHGDDLRRIDWKLFGRSDRYFIRESEIETSVTVRLLLDATGSMAHEEEGITKFDYARFLLAALAVLAHRQGDAVGLYAIKRPALGLVPPARHPHHIHRILRELELLVPGEAWPDWRRVESLLATGGRNLTILVTDLSQQAREITTALQRLAALGDEVLVFHLMGRAELEFTYQEPATFEELETGKRVEVDPLALRSAYLEAAVRDLKALREELEERRIGYVRLLIDEPLDAGLRSYLQTRQRPV